MTDVASNGSAQLIFRKENSEFSMQLPPWDVQATENRNAVIEIGGNINGLPLPEPGNYEFVLLWNGSEIASRRMNVAKIDLDNAPPPPNAKQ